MAETSKIEWTDATWNPVTGCSVVSPGCANCYAMRMAGTRLKDHPSRAGLTVASKAGPVWNGHVRLNEGWLDEPLRWRGRKMIFVCAHGDLFHESVPDDWIDRVFAVMALCPQHTFQVLTKRAGRMRDYFTQDDGFGRWGYIEHRAKQMFRIPRGKTLAPYGGRNLPNVWLGVSVEDQRRADERIPDRLATPAAVRFVSAEPLLGPVKLPAGLGWVIVGGESGPGARPMHPDWARSLRDQCAAAGVPFFFKQWGEWLEADQFFERIERGPAFIAVDGRRWRPSRPLNFEDAARLAKICGHPCEQHSDGSTHFRLGKGRAGALLDGREWREMPGHG